MLYNENKWKKNGKGFLVLRTTSDSIYILFTITNLPDTTQMEWKYWRKKLIGVYAQEVMITRVSVSRVHDLDSP